MFSQGSDDDLEEEEEEDEDEELKVPEEEITMERETVTEDEKQAIPEFFEGRPSKTPERYLKIRNYILDQWYETRFISSSITPHLCRDFNVFVHQVEEQAQVPEQDLCPPRPEELWRRQLHRENTHLPGAYRSHQLQLWYFCWAWSSIYSCSMFFFLPFTQSFVSSLTEQAVYNRPKVVDRSKHKVGKDVLEAYQLAQRLQSMVGAQDTQNVKQLN